MAFTSWAARGSPWHEELREATMNNAAYYLPLESRIDRLTLQSKHAKHALVHPA
jgi:hypothetical protein